MQTEVNLKQRLSANLHWRVGHGGGGGGVGLEIIRKMVLGGCPSRKKISYSIVNKKTANSRIRDFLTGNKVKLYNTEMKKFLHKNFTNLVSMYDLLQVIGLLWS